MRVFKSIESGVFAKRKYNREITQTQTTQTQMETSEKPMRDKKERARQKEIEQKRKTDVHKRRIYQMESGSSTSPALLMNYKWIIYYSEMGI